MVMTGPNALASVGGRDAVAYAFAAVEDLVAVGHVQHGVGEAAEADEVGGDDFACGHAGGDDACGHQAGEGGLEADRIEPVLTQSVGLALAVGDVAVPGVDHLAVRIPE